MKVRLGKKILSAALCAPLVAVSTPVDAGAAMYFQSPASHYSGQGAPQTAAELQGLVAPIALYPDALVAQILSGRNVSGPGRRCRQLTPDQQGPYRQRLRFIALRKFRDS